MSFGWGVWWRIRGFDLKKKGMGGQRGGGGGEMGNSEVAGLEWTGQKKDAAKVPS